MSGGSFNYLCFKGAEELLSGHCDEDISDMADALDQMGSKRAADATRRILEVLKDAKEKISAAVGEVSHSLKTASLADVWHAVEWWHSCDWDESGARAVVIKWETSHD